MVGCVRAYTNSKKIVKDVLLDEVQATVASLVNGLKRPKRGPLKSERQSTYGRSEKCLSPSSAHQTDKKGSKGRSTRAARPNYVYI